MGDLAAKRMTLAEFLVWDDGTDVRHELVDGQPCAMAPASGRHAVIQDNAGAVIRDKLRRDGPCRVAHQAGLRLTVHGEDRYYVPDVAVTCHEVTDAPYIEEPKLVVEIISPSTGRMDKDLKVPDYCTLESLDEIWLIDSRKPLVHVYQRRNGQWIGSVPLKLGQHFESVFLGSEIAIADLYLRSGLELPAEPDAQPSSGQS